MTGRYKAYPEYKSTDEVWLGDVPSHWRVLKINRLTIVKRGASPRPIDDPKYFDESGEYAWVRIADVTASDTYLANTTQRLSPLGASLSVKLEPDELFLSIAGTVGKPCINKIKACIHDGFVYFPEYKENTKFLFYIFAAGEAYKGLGKFGTQLNLNTETVGGIKIGIPCIEEQHKIVNFLDHETAKIDTLITKQEKLIELLKEKRQAVISHAVTKGLNPDAPMKDSGVEWLGEVPEHWTVMRLKHLIKSLESGCSVNAADIPANKNELGVLKTSCVYTRRFRASENKTVVKEDLSRVKCPVRKGAIIISRMNTPELVGASALVDTEANNLFLPDRLWQTIFNEQFEVNPEFLAHFMTVEGFRNQISLSAEGASSSMQNIAKEDYLAINALLPQLKEQAEIVSYIKENEAKFLRLEAQAVNAIELMKERKTALISAAVTGKIDVRDWQPQGV
ncbi:restriction endonuclease subunit S [Vibrio alginolyticus]|uniref:restriction endonuclease subunit S n=1 Tax=Vibrio alginolyticus TaxID=663 RepID=UPI00301BB8E1